MVKSSDGLMLHQPLPEAAGPGDPDAVPSGFLAVDPSKAVAPPAFKFHRGSVL